MSKRNKSDRQRRKCQEKQQQQATRRQENLRRGEPQVGHVALDLRRTRKFCGPTGGC